VSLPPEDRVRKLAQDATRQASVTADVAEKLEELPMWIGAFVKWAAPLIRQANASAAGAGELEGELWNLAGDAPRKPGRPRAKTPPNFRPDVKTLHEEHSLSEREIAAKLGVSRWQVRRAKKEFVGEKPSAQRGRS
jgi:hypothetical protein